MSSERPQPRWIAFAFALNVALAVAHVVVFGLTKSRLVLAQGADSLMDVAAVAVLAVSAQVARRPRDEDHPFGHGRAEPIGALLVAAFAGVLAFEVGRSAIAALLGHDDASIDASVAGVLALKLGVKTLFVVVLARRARASRSPALSSTRATTSPSPGARSSGTPRRATASRGPTRSSPCPYACISHIMVSPSRERTSAT